MNAGPSEPHAGAAPTPSAPHPRRPLRGIPTSRAYWELKAEQMMNRIFDPEAVVDLPVEDAPPPPRRRLPEGGASSAAPRPATPGPAAAPTALRREIPVLLLATLGGVCLVSAVGTAFSLASWNQAQQNLRQERNLLLVERLRSLGPATAAQPVLAQPLPAPQATAGVDLPPPPPADDTWMQELGNLPRSSSDQAPVLRVPLSPRLAATAP
ncbi:MAG: hypothetical protein ACK522_12365, partial [Synechococcaceae cyanobacterium]